MKLPRSSDHSSRRRRGELGDEEGWDRFAAENPEAAMQRREFLGRTAALAGLGAVAALPTETLVATAARQQLRRGFPSPRNLPIDTFVVLMMENRSFDHFFGWRADADGRTVGLSYPDATDSPVATHHLIDDYQGCGFRDPDHSWEGGRWQYGRGRMDGFVQGNRNGTGSDAYAAGFYLRDDLPYIADLADAFTLYDRWFTSLMASTFPNRHYQMSAQSGGTVSNVVPPQTADPIGYQWETIFDRALARGVGVGYYVSDLPAPGLYGQRANRWVRPAQQFYADAAAGQLPPITFIDPPFGDIGALGGGASDHPHSDIRLGQAFMADVVDAFVNSPQYRRGALFVDYDEWGGFFDHVPPVTVPDQRSSRHLNQNFGLSGFRIPAVSVSPYSRGGAVNHMTLTHESILKLMSHRYSLGYLNVRHRYASNIGRSFDFGQPDFNPPQLPTPASIVATPCNPSAQGRENVDGHDFTSPEYAEFIDRAGVKRYEATPEAIYRSPQSIKAARRAAKAAEARNPSQPG